MTLHRHKICGYTELAGLDDTIPGSGFGDDELGNLGSAVGTGASLGAAAGSVVPGIGTAIGGAVGGLAGALSSIFGGSKKHKQPKPNLASMVDSIAGVAGITPPQLEVIVRSLIATVPPPVQQQMMDVIHQVQYEGGNMKHAEQALVSNIEAKFMPAINLAVQALKRAHTQRTATSEHRGAMKDAKRWDESRRAQRIILKRLATLAEHQASIDARLGGATILPKSKATYLGGKRLVDLLASKR